MGLRLSGGRRLQSPPGNTARPTSARVRLAAVTLLAAELPGCAWLDLCSGSGVMACEALQRGARRVVAVEQDRRIAAVARANLQAVAAGLSHPASVEVHCREVLRWLQRPAAASEPAETRADAATGKLSETAAERFDLVYVDPPYAAGLYEPIAAAITAGQWLSSDGTLVWECASDQVPAVPTGWRQRDRRRYGGTSLLLLEQDR
jgi:16S rRNA (guanine(966)-N(2))-methyltransferase RsmD